MESDQGYLSNKNLTENTDITSILRHPYISPGMGEIEIYSNKIMNLALAYSSSCQED
jgi:hypothetical protein